MDMRPFTKPSEAMKLKYISISSLGSSEWGALDLNASWPKMEKILYDNNLISHTSNKFTYGGSADYLKKGSDSRSDYGGLLKRDIIDSLMIDIYPEKTLNDLFLVQDLSPSDEAFPSDVKNHLDIGREYYALAINIARRLDIYEKGNVSNLNKKLFSDLIEDYIYFDENGDSVIYIDRITTIKSKQDTTLEKRFENNFDLIEKDTIPYNEECVQPSRNRDKVGSISPESLSALLYVCNEKNLKCLEPIYYEKEIDNIVSPVDGVDYYRDVNCNGIKDEKKDDNGKKNYKLSNLGIKYKDEIRSDISDSYDLSHYKAYINIGGNIASFGYKNKEKFEKRKGYGFLEPYKVNEILSYNPDGKSLRRGVITHFANSNIPVINFIEIEKMINDKDLKYFDRKLDGQQIQDSLDIDNDGMVDIAKGNLYQDKKYSLIFVWLSLMVSLGLIVYIGFISYRQISDRMKDYNPND